MKCGQLEMRPGKNKNMFENIYKDKRVLITGHTGFKGTWLTMWLLNLGAEVAGYSIGIPTNPSHFEELKLNGKIKHFIGDIRDYKDFYHVCDEFKPEFIFHLAAQPLVRESYNNPKETFEVNMLGTLNVLETIRNLKNVVKVGVIITSDKAYDNVEWVYGYREDDKLGGEDPYSGSKGAAELVSKSYMNSFFQSGFPNIATTRAGNVIGGGDWAKDRIIPDIVRSWSENKQVEIRSPYSTRPWQHVLEPLSGYLCLGAELYKQNSIYRNMSFNFGPDSKVNKNVGELIEEMKNKWTESPGWVNKFINDDKPEANLLKLSCDRANILLKWYPVMDFIETVDFTMNWYLNYYKLKSSVFDFTIKQINKYTNKAKERNILWSIN
jgi:CDP-glucose 4,6-dehydratase